MGEKKSEARDETIMKYRAKPPPLGSTAKRKNENLNRDPRFISLGSSSTNLWAEDGAQTRDP